MKHIPGLKPVRDFHASSSEDIAALIEQMGKGGGLMSRNMFEVASTMRSMVDREGCTKFLSFPAIGAKRPNAAGISL